MCQCVLCKYSNLVLALTQKTLFLTSYSFSCPVLHYKMAKTSSDKWFKCYLPQFGKHGVLTCLRFGWTCHNTAVCWISKKMKQDLHYNEVQMKPFKMSVLQIWVLHHCGLQLPQKGATRSQRRHQQAVCEREACM